VFWFSVHIWSEKFLSIRRIQWDIVIKVHTSQCKVPVILVSFYETSIFSTNFRKIIKYQISWKSVRWEPRCSMRSEGRTDRPDETLVAFLIQRRRLKTESNIVATIYNFANITTRHRKPRKVRKAEEIWCRVRIHYFNIFAISKAVERLKQLSRSNNDIKNSV